MDVYSDRLLLCRSLASSRQIWLGRLYSQTNVGPTYWYQNWWLHRKLRISAHADLCEQRTLWFIHSV